ncbi:MAG: hypothetical protein RLZZ338_1943 [Cyanobacteriota bacterium]|jgi:hypothetical protein
MNFGSVYPITKSFVCQARLSITRPLSLPFLKIACATRLKAISHNNSCRVRYQKGYSLDH